MFLAQFSSPNIEASKASPMFPDFINDQTQSVIHLFDEFGDLLQFGDE